MSLSTAIGNFLYHRAFALYRPAYYAFKRMADRHELELLRRFVKPGATVLDIGANIGFYAAQLSALAGERGRVHCFEPDPANFSKLQRARFPFGNVVRNQLAVADREGEISFYTSHELNVDHRAYRPEKYDREIRVKAVRVDDYLRSQNISHVDLIKMDIQGFEFHALKGMADTMARNPDLVLVSELWPYGLGIAGSSAKAYFEALKALGMNVYLAAKTLTPLTEAQVAEMEGAGKAYYNIVATKRSV